MAQLRWLRLWFLLRDPVTRTEYALSGFGLMGLKYIVEFLVLGGVSGLIYTPLDFVNPLINSKEQFLRGGPPWLGMAWVVWSLPFLWIAVGMSVRRALDAGVSPWHGLWIFVPYVNLAVMLLLACLPSAEVWSDQWNPDAQRLEPYQTAQASATVKAALGGIVVGALYAAVTILIQSYLIEDYGEAMFLGTPFVTGVAASYLLNLRSSQSLRASFFVALMSVILCGGALLLFAAEGVICLMMAAPLVVPMGLAGAPIGKFLADRRRRLRGGLIGALVVVPLWAMVESRVPNTSEFVVASAIDIKAPREAVWQQVIAFPEIDEQPEWFFRLGIACPEGARIKGTGIGAERECIFTTGKFIEPITAWDAPRRLAFDVREQPAPMFELTPYRHIHPPHLDLAFLSQRGEFELVDLPGGGTRLIGRTWYTLDIRPHDYWTIWADWLVHRIHQRVLRHIKRLAEDEDG